MHDIGKALLQAHLCTRNMDEPGQTVQQRKIIGIIEVESTTEQQRLWLLDQVDPGTTAYNMACVLRLGGPLDAAAGAVNLHRRRREPDTGGWDHACDHGATGPHGAHFHRTRSSG